MINYISTRGQAPVLSFKDVVMAGLASDGGLYVPDSIPVFAPHELTQMAALPYTELALRVMQPFIGDSIPSKDLAALIEESYTGFRHKAIAPLKQLGHNDFLLELFHGPTLAFKDFALQFLGRVLEYFLEKEHKQLTVVGATSGDTGSAAIEGCRGRKNMRIFILHPHGRVSDVQRRQMTTVADDNVFNLAVKGTFDDCQDIVKSLFADQAFREKQHLTAVNSINWARILAQVVYYFYAGLALGAPARQVSFCVPTGNFGDIFAGYIAHKMGLPIGKLIIATNSNDILARCLKTGTYDMAGVSPTLSPSMDIQISSNFERLLFDLYGRDGKAIAGIMQDFREKRSFTLTPAALQQLRGLFAAESCDDERTLATIRSVQEETGELLDPHSAVGVAVARKLNPSPVSPVVTLATAHPAKFPDAVKKATGIHPALPEHVAGIMDMKERLEVVANDFATIKQSIESRS
ncbi:MAG TPA: threonine synthase [Rickettsiales bacterium]|nr:threonine synthase [Rickettsiales bacterium]